MTIKEKQDELIDTFSLFDEWTDKYEHIIQMGKDLPLIDPALKTDDRLIRGCQSRVWLQAEMKDGKLYFTADSDAVITRGLVSMVVDVLSGQTPADIAEADIYFIDAIGLRSHLSLTRSNGLLSMLRQIKAYALAYQAKEKQ
ncbi:MAG: SufE family protein [Flavihumibacter sp.]